MYDKATVGLLGFAFRACTLRGQAPLTEPPSRARIGTVHLLCHQPVHVVRNSGAKRAGCQLLGEKACAERIQSPARVKTKGKPLGEKACAGCIQSRARVKTKGKTFGSDPSKFGRQPK